MKAWADRLRNCAVRELPGFYREMATLMKELKTRDEAGMALQLLCARWAELDAPGGMAFFTKVQESEINPREKDSWSRIWLLTEWALRDPQAAGRAVHALPDKEAQGEILDVGMQLLKENPDKFWIWFQQNHKPLPSTWRAGEPNWSVVVRAHFEEFSVIAAEMLAAPEPADPNDKRRRQSELEELHGLLAARRAEQDADKALAWAKTLPESLRGNALKGVLEVVAKKSPEKIGDFLLLIKDKQVGANVFAGSGAGEIVREAMAVMGSRDPLGLVDWLRVNTNKLGREGIHGPSELAAALSNAVRDGGITVEQAFNALVPAKSDHDVIRLNVLNKMWSGIPADKLAAAAEWLKGQEDPRARDMALGGLFPVWAVQDPEAAMKFAVQLKDREMGGALFRGMVRDSAGKSPEELFKVIPSEYRAEALAAQMGYLENGLLSPTPSFEPSALTRMLEDLPPSAGKDAAVTGLGREWGIVDPASALAWANAQGGAALREKATGAVVESWAKEDAWGASQWINALPAGEQRDTAAHHLARVLRTDEPESAWTWAGSIGDSATRLEAQAAVLRKWRDSSSAEAQAAVDGLLGGLAPADRMKLLDTLEHRDVPK